MPKQRRTIRVVVDTNVIISKFISRTGTAGRAFDFVVEKCVFLMCSEGMAELANKLSEPKFSRYGSDEEKSEFIAAIDTIVEYVTVQSEAVASNDPKDNIFLALAFDGRADYIVSGDKEHLQALESYEGIPILSPAKFLVAMGH